MPDQGTEGLFSPYLRKKRIEVALPYLKGKILDYGCGSGALAKWVPPEQYLGVDIDPESLEKAAFLFPQHRFVSELTMHLERYDTVISLAMIEHVNQPVQLLKELASYLKDTTSHLLLTTPHPKFEWIHTMGAYMGLFSKHGSEEHKDLLNYHTLKETGIQAELELLYYQRFLLGANQVAVYRKKSV